MNTRSGRSSAHEERIARRRAAVPTPSYPPELPVSQSRDDLLAAIREHQVVIVAGETGSGKTTQLPKICLELGRGVTGMIGHTQPRRLAARTVAERLAHELGTTLGGPDGTVGYQVRFTGKVGDSTLVKLMTDGILLSEIKSDRMLRRYDTLIIDEAHERSLNIDFILGYLKQLLPKRPDLKVIITSATIDPERFARHFDGAPVLEVSGRTYPVEVRYRPVVDPDDPDADPDRDQVQAVCDAVDELCAEGPGDVLVFLSGEREISDTADALRTLDPERFEVLPLYARLSAAEQYRVFQPHGRRRIVLATNVAETSLTVPGIKYVVDPGTARISRYSNRTKVQRLPIERISQASANQRKGRCGRTSDGICIRLYTETDFADRQEFTDPEILRTNLASVILQMTAARLGDIADFGFLDPPDRRAITDGVNLLYELGALERSKKGTGHHLTATGRRLAQLPIDPRLARMVLEGARNGCAHEVMVIAAALSIQDPRERPADKRQAADEQHARFTERDSDFLTFLNLWNYLTERQRQLSSNQFRKLCRAEYLNYLRVREWQDIYGQLRQIGKSIDVTVNREPAEPQRVHVSLLAGLLSHIGLRDGEKNEYLGARNARFAIFPGSRLFSKPPRWLMAAELVETSRLWARMAARIDPDWIEPLAGHLVSRSYSEPHWSQRQGAVLGYERVTLYGVPIVVSRKVNYGRIDPPLARELFIRHALVNGEWDGRHTFLGRNRELLDEVAELENRARRRDIVVDDEVLFDFYDRRVGADVVSARHFDAWWKRARRDEPDLLTFDRAMLVNEAAGGITEGDYPDVWQQGELRLALRYEFEPGAEADGVTVDIPLAVLNQVRPDGFDWQVPGLREQLVTAMLKSLPKPLRRQLVPVGDVARAVLAGVGPADGPLLDVLERQLSHAVDPQALRVGWQPGLVPDHLKITFRVLDERGAVLATGKDLDALKTQLRPTLRAALAESLSPAATGIERRGLTRWDIDSLPRSVEQRRDGHVLRAYPALRDEGDSVAVRLFDTEAAARRQMWAGTRRLLLLGQPSVRKGVQNRLPAATTLALRLGPHPADGDLLDDCVACALDGLIADGGGPAWDAAGFARLDELVRERLTTTVLDIVGRVEPIVTTGRDVRRRLDEQPSAFESTVADAGTQLARLVYPGFVTATGRERLPDVLRYLRGIDRRLDKLAERPQRDLEWMQAIERVQQDYQRALAALPSGSPAAAEIRWMIEELRISYFAQTLGTAYPVSEKRIGRAIDQLV